MRRLISSLRTGISASLVPRHNNASNSPKEVTVRTVKVIRSPCYALYTYGDELEVAGSLETPAVFERFSCRDHLAWQRIHALMGHPGITLLRQGGGNSLHRTLLAFKARAQTTVARILAEPEASPLTGILLGVEAGMPEKVEEAFSATGTTHVIAISGFN